MHRPTYMHRPTCGTTTTTIVEQQRQLQIAVRPTQLQYYCSRQMVTCCCTPSCFIASLHGQHKQRQPICGERSVRFTSVLSTHKLKPPANSSYPRRKLPQELSVVAATRSIRGLSIGLSLLLHFPLSISPCPSPFCHPSPFCPSCPQPTIVGEADPISGTKY